MPTVEDSTDTYSARLARHLCEAERVARELASTAAGRDEAGASPTEEVRLLREANLLQVQESRRYGGSDLTYADCMAIVRVIAAGDTNIAQLLAYHYNHSRHPKLFGTDEQIETAGQDTATKRLFWGGAQNPRGGSVVVLTHGPDGFELNGRRTFASGSRVADHLSVSATLDGELVMLSLPSGREGIRPWGEWNNIGQRLTDSGGVEFRRVEVFPEEILGSGSTPLAALAPFQTLMTPTAQLGFVNFYLGTALGALDEAIEWIRERGSPWESSGVDRAADDPYVLRTIGELVSALRAAVALADHAGRALQEAIDVGKALTVEQRSLTAISVYEAKVVATEVALDTTNRLFELQGARATTRAYGFDRHWRNIRTHTLHDPVAYKAREVGEWALTGTEPAFSSYR